MTICIAALCRWNYGPSDSPEWGPAAIVVTDRMITAGDVQYEPPQTKHAQITPHVLLVIAGDYSSHSQAIKRTVQHFNGSTNATPEDVAAFYGRAIQSLKLKEAEDLYLAPLGLNSDSFLAQQADMDSNFVSRLTDQMQSYRGEEMDALVVGGIPSKGRVHVYGVDTKGMISCHDDVGFAAIGSGSWHAKSRMMQAGYVNTNTFAAATCVTFAAKKASEIAPGVGSNTDIMLVFRNSCEPLHVDVGRKVNELYLEYVPRLHQIGVELIDRFQASLNKPLATTIDESSSELPGGDAQINESGAQPSAESATSAEAVRKSKYAT